MNEITETDVQWRITQNVRAWFIQICPCIRASCSCPSEMWVYRLYWQELWNMTAMPTNFTIETANGAWIITRIGGTWLNALIWRDKSSFFLQNHRDASSTGYQWRSLFNSSLTDTRAQAAQQRLLRQQFSSLLCDEGRQSRCSVRDSPEDLSGLPSPFSTTCQSGIPASLQCGRSFWFPEDSQWTLSQISPFMVHLEARLQ